MPTAAPGEAELVVLVDNRFDWERCPLHLEYYDWYHYGGITRPVELQRLGELWIDDLRVESQVPASELFSERPVADRSGTKFRVIALQTSVNIDSLVGHPRQKRTQSNQVECIGGALACRKAISKTE